MAPHEKFRFREPGDLLTKAGALGLHIPFEADASALFETETAAGMALANRLAVLPLEGADADATGAPSDLTFRRYRRFAQGGCGLIWFEAAAVVPEGRANPHQLAILPGTLEGLRQLVEETRRSWTPPGPRGDGPCLILQLTHSGRFSRPGDARAPVTAVNRPSLDARLGLPGDLRPVSDADLDGLIEAYVRAARLAAAAGFTGVDIKACHGYLISDLLSAKSRKDSRYGGTFENRSRFLLEVVRRVRAEAPKLAVACRLGIYDGTAGSDAFGVDGEDQGREDLAEPRALLRSLGELGVSFIGLSLGLPFLRPQLSRPFNTTYDPVEPPEEHPLEGIARILRLTAKLQAEFPTMIFVGSGYSWLQRFWPGVAAAALREGVSRMAGLGRAMLAYPTALHELASRGALDPKKACTACSRCSRMLRAGVPVGCPVRDAAYERGYKDLGRARRRA